MKGRMNFKMFTMKGSNKKVAVNDEQVILVQEEDGRTVIDLVGEIKVGVVEDFDTVFSRLNTKQSSIMRKGRVKTHARKFVEGFADGTERAEAK